MTWEKGRPAAHREVRELTLHDSCDASRTQRNDGHARSAWLRITHYVNLLFLVLLIRSGLQILIDHPRLYGNVHCTPGTEWLRLTPVEVPKDRVSTNALIWC